MADLVHDEEKLIKQLDEICSSIFKIERRYRDTTNYIHRCLFDARISIGMAQTAMIEVQKEKEIR